MTIARIACTALILLSLAPAIALAGEDRHGPLRLEVESLFPEATPGGFQEVRLNVFNAWKPHAIDATITGVTIDADGTVIPFSGPFTITLEPRSGFEILSLLLVDDEAAPGPTTVLVTVDAVRTERPGRDGDKGPTFSVEADDTYVVVD